MKKGRAVHIDYVGRDPTSGLEQYSWQDRSNGNEADVVLSRHEITKKLRGAYHGSVLDFGTHISDQNIVHFKRAAYS